MPAVSLTKRPDGVAVITLDTPDSPVNVLRSTLFADVEAILTTIEQDPEIRAAVLASAKKDSFVAGADIQELLNVTRPEEAEALSRGGQALFNRIEASKKPVVAAIHGVALGGGLELALACHYRLATDDPKTSLGLPEVQLGLLPGAGGTQRLPRLIGLEKALPMILAGERVRAKKALKYGLVDALTSPGGLVDTAARAALMLADKTLKPKRGEKSLKDNVMDFAPVREFIFSKAKESVDRKTYGNYPAPYAIIECVKTGLNQGFKAGLETEARLFGKLAVSPEAKQLIWIFNAMNELKKLPKEPAPRPVKKLGVLGAGLMGEGIASVSLPLSNVVVKDITPESLGRAGKSLHASMAKRVKSGSLANVDKDRQWAKLSFTTDYDQLKGCDLVIEAVFEKLELKRQVLADVEAVVGPECVFASNTSALPIGEIAALSPHPERVLGMHYFSPVPKMPLLEIVVTPKTADWALATAKAYGVAQGKTVIVVKDGPGFYTTRILAPFMNEALLLLEEGAEIGALERALKKFGFPVGPVALMDEVGIDVAAHVARDLGAAFASRGLKTSDATTRMAAAGYAGRKNGKGFYQYTGSKGPKQVNPEVYSFFGGPVRKSIDDRDMVDRMAFMFVNEAVQCLIEGVIENPRDGDIGAIMGLGFPPFLGGPFHYVDTRGVSAVVARMEELASRFGPRFTPAPLLTEMAAEGKRFYESERVAEPV